MGRTENIILSEAAQSQKDKQHIALDLSSKYLGLGVSIGVSIETRAVGKGLGEGAVQREEWYTGAM